MLNGNPFQYSCLDNPMDGGTWQAIVYGVAKSQTQLSDFIFRGRRGRATLDSYLHYFFLTKKKKVAKA